MTGDEFKHLSKKLGDIETSVAAIDKTLVKQEANLSEHMRRTSILENELKPIKSHVEQMRGAGKTIFWISLVAGIVASIKALL